MPANNDTIILEGDSSGLVSAVDRASKAWNTYNQQINNTINLNNNVQNNFMQTNTIINQTTSSMASANKEAKGLTVTLGGMAKLVGVQLIHRSISALVRGLIDGAKEAVEVEKALAEVRTISQDNQLSTEAWFQGVKKLSNAYGTDLKDQIEAAYQTLSNQVAKGGDVFRFLAEANEFAAAAVTDSATSVNLLTAAINSYGLEANSARGISAQFFKTIELGRVRASEMANSFGDISIMASQLGIQLHEVLGTVATLSIQGVKYNKVATQLRGIFQKLLNPTKEMTALFREWGVENAQQAITTYGTVGVLEKLNEAINGNISTAGKLFPRARALTGVLGILGENLPDLIKNMHEVANATDSYNTAVSEVLNNAGKRAEIASTRVKNAFLENGMAILEFWTDIIADVSGIYDQLDKAREKAGIAAKFEVEMIKTNKAFSDSLELQHRAYMKHVADMNILSDERTKDELKSYEEVASAAELANKSVMRSVEATVTASQKEFERLSSSILDANKLIIDLIHEEDRTLFSWSQDTRNTVEQIDAITKRIRELDKKQLGASQAGDLKLFKQVSKEVIDLYKEQRKLTLKLNKDNEKGQEKRLELARKIEKTEHEAANKLAELEEKRRGSKPSAKRGIDREMIEVRKAATREVAALREEYAGVEILEKRTLDTQKAITKEYEQQRMLAAEIATENTKRAESARQQLVLQELYRDQLKEAFKEHRKFDLDKTIVSSDPQTLRAAAAERKKVLSEIMSASKDLGLDTSVFSKTEEAINKSTKLLEERANRLEDQATKTKNLTNAQKELKASAEELSKATRIQKEELASLSQIQSELLDVAQNIPGVVSKDVRNAYSQIQGIFGGLDLSNLDTTNLKSTIRILDELALQIINAKSELGEGPTENIQKGEVAQRLSQMAQLLKSQQDSRAQIGEAVKVQEALQALIDEAVQGEKEAVKEVTKQNTELKKAATNHDTLILKAKQLTEEYRLQTEELLKQNLLQQPEGAPQINNPVDKAGTTNTTGTINNIGDIKVNLNSTGNVTYDAALLGREIKRVARRGMV